MIWRDPPAGVDAATLDAAADYLARREYREYIAMTAWRRSVSAPHTHYANG
jgi:hypothetical protein